MDELNLKKCIEEIDASFFCYDLDALEKHLQGFQQYTEHGIKLWYACKANPLSAILQKFYQNGFGIDIASLGELEQVVKQGVPGSSIISTGPGKSKRYLASLIDKGVGTVVLESLNQALWLNEVACERGVKVNALLRGQLDWEKEKSVLGGSEITPFGVSMDEWLKLDYQTLPGINIIGFHVFQWGNLLDLSRLEHIWTQITEEVSKYAKLMGLDDYIVDLGGGIGIPYHESQKAVKQDELLQTLVKVKKKFNIKEIWLELGRYAIGEYGVYCSQVIDRKDVKGKTLLVLEGGINHLLRPGLTKESFPIRVIGREEDSLKNFSIHGPLCTALDFHGEYLMPESTTIGDWIVFDKVGAYGFTESMPFFLCHHLPAEVVVEKSQLNVLRPVKPASSWLV